MGSMGLYMFRRVNLLLVFNRFCRLAFVCNALVMDCMRASPAHPGATEGAHGALGSPEALRAGGLGKHGLAITRSVLERHGLSKGCGLAVCGEAVRG